MLFDELAEKWIDSIEERVRKTTLCTYRASLSRAMRYLEGKEIGDITGQDLRAMEDGLIQGGGSYQTARLLFNVVRLSLGYAVEEGLLSSNPAERYTPDRGSYRQTEKTRAAAPMDVTSLIKSYPFLCIPIICCCTARSARFVYLRAAEEEVNRTSPCGGHTRRKRGW